jgi:hypothetical protein
MPEWSQRINFHFMPRLHDLNLSEIAKRPREDIKSNKKHEFKRHIVYNNDFLIHFVYISLLLGAIITITIYCRKRRIKSINIDKIRDIELDRYERRDDNAEDRDTAMNNHTDDIERIGSPGKLRRTEKVLFLSTIIAVMAMPSTAIDHNFIVLSIRFRSPCKAIELSKTNTGQISLCQKQFDLAFQQPIKSFCKINREILSIEKELYTRDSFKRRREINNTLDHVSDITQFRATSIVASLAVLKENTTTIERKWIKNEIDLHIVEKSHFRIDFPKDLKLNEFKPHLCIADFKCDYIILMLKRNHKLWHEKYCLEVVISNLIILSAIFTCIAVLKSSRGHKKQPSNYKVLYDRKLSESLIERTLPLPPFLTVSNV